MEVKTCEVTNERALAQVERWINLNPYGKHRRMMLLATALGYPTKGAVSGWMARGHIKPQLRKQLLETIKALLEEHRGTDWHYYNGRCMPLEFRYVQKRQVS